MKKLLVIWVILFLGFSSRSFASAGIARDGLEFTFVLVFFLLILAGVLRVIDYIQKNGKKMFLKIVGFFKEKVHQLRNLLVNVNYESSSISNFNA